MSTMIDTIQIVQSIYQLTAVDGRFNVVLGHLTYGIEGSNAPWGQHNFLDFSVLPAVIEDLQWYDNPPKELSRLFFTWI
jgi:hypothetical protein